MSFPDTYYVCTVRTVRSSTVERRFQRAPSSWLFPDLTEKCKAAKKTAGHRRRVCLASPRQMVPSTPPTGVVAAVVDVTGVIATSVVVAGAYALSIVALGIDTLFIDTLGLT